MKEKFYIIVMNQMLLEQWLTWLSGFKNYLGFNIGRIMFWLNIRLKKSQGVFYIYDVDE